MVFRRIEIYYDIDQIPGLSEEGTGSGLPCQDGRDRALDFRGEAIELIENALVAAEMGEWEAAGIGRGAVHLGFAVDEFDAAEEVVRKAVAGTPFSGIREIVRSEQAAADRLH